MKKIISGDYTLYNEDCQDVLKAMIERGETVHSIITDPPYSLESIVKRFSKINTTTNTRTNRALKGRVDPFNRTNVTPSGKGFLNQAWDATGIERSSDFWRLCFNVLPPGGYLLVFGHCRTVHRTASAIEDAGFDIRNQLSWVTAQNFPKNRFVSKDIDKIYGCTPTVVGRRKHPTLKDQSKLTRTGKQNFHGSNPIKEEWDLTEPTSDEAKYWKGYGNAIKVSYEPIILAQKPIEKNIAKNVLKYGVGVLNIDGCRLPDIDGKHDLGRFPSNFIHDNSPAVRKMFASTTNNDTAGRFFFVPKPSKRERSEGLTSINPHPTVKPICLMAYLSRLVTPRHGIILDTFLGSGSTGCAAISENFKFIGIELSTEYFEVACKRLQFWSQKTKPKGTSLTIESKKPLHFSSPKKIKLRKSKPQLRVKSLF